MQGSTLNEHLTVPLPGQFSFIFCLSYLENAPPKDWKTGPWLSLWLWPFLIIYFTLMQFFKFLSKNAKDENRLYLLPYEEILEGTQTFRPIVSSLPFSSGRSPLNLYLGKTFRSRPIHRKDVSPPCS